MFALRRNTLNFDCDQATYKLSLIIWVKQEERDSSSYLLLDPESDRNSKHGYPKKLYSSPGEVSERPPGLQMIDGQE